MFIVLAHWNNSTRVDMSLHSDTVSWFRAKESLLFLLNAACLAEKQQPDRGEKLVPNTFIMFGVFFIYRIKSCSYSYPNLFSRSWWLLNISNFFRKKYRIKIEWNVWKFHHLAIGHTCVIYYDVCYLTLF
jgi:hypothetical protein